MKFTSICRELALKGYAPPDFINDKESDLVKAGLYELNTNGVEYFGDYLLEGTYFIFLWSAMIILEYGNANSELKEQCINKIAINIPGHVNESKLAKWLKIYEL